MKIQKILAAGIVLTSVALWAEEGEVAVGTLNVRAKMNTRSDVVCKLKKGDKIEVVNRFGQWLEIRTPKGASVYAASRFVKDGKTTSEIRLRVGPGTQYASVGTVPPGVAVTVEENKGEWVKIAALNHTKCFVHAKYIRLASSPTAGEKPTTGKSTGEKPSADKQAAVDSEAAAALAALRKSYIDGSSEVVEVQGIVKALNSKVKCLRYALAESRNGKLVPVAFLASERPTQLANFFDRAVLVKGKQCKVDKWAIPVIEVDTIKLNTEK
ncbi:MAG: SH3 domain-containing protein [Victivallaceae bacterium]|nr:SH3 domain-containing protein [Victivallaceae bacterium]